jgi:hypothetical protein
MTWQFDGGYATPADFLYLGEAAYRNILIANEALTFPLRGRDNTAASGTAVASWEVIDHTGLTVASGTGFTAGATWTLATSLPTGWYRVLFRRASPLPGWGLSQGGGMFLITRSVTGMPPRPPINLPGSGKDTVADTGLYAVTLTGPVRFDATISDPTYQSDNTRRGLDQLATYYTPYDTTRPKPALIAFPDGTDTANAAADAATVAAVVAQFPEVTHFEGQNEPNGNPGAEFVPVMQRFYANVKAARASAQVCGPSNVTIGGKALDRLGAFFAAGGGQYIDTLSFHTYNAHQGDLPLGRKTWDSWVGLLTQYGLQGKPRLNTEASSMLGAEYGAGQPIRQAVRTMLDLFLGEQYGVPKERWSWFYSTSHGFWDFPSFMENGAVSAFPAIAALLTHSQELLGTTFEARLDFGTADNDHLIGSRHRRSNGTGVVAMMSAGRADAVVALQLTGGSPTSLTVIDAFGRTRTAAVTGGLATVTVGTLPVYVQLPAGITATPVSSSTRLGTNRTGSATAAATGGSYRLTSALQVLTGPWRNNAYFDADNNGDGNSVWLSKLQPTPAAPVDFTVTLPSAVPVDTAIVHCPPPRQGTLNVIRDADVQVLVDGAWQTVKTIGYKPRTEPVVSDNRSGFNGWVEVFDQDVHVFEVTFPKVIATAVRLHVREVSAGGAPTIAALHAFGTTTASGGVITAGMGSDAPQLSLQRVALYDSTSSAVPAGQPAADPGPTPIGTGRFVRRRTT